MNDNSETSDKELHICNDGLVRLPLMGIRQYFLFEEVVVVEESRNASECEICRVTKSS